MNAAGRIGVYAGGLVVAFVGAFAIANLVVPDSLVQQWAASASDSPTGNHAGMDMTSTADPALPGLGIEQYGFELGAITAPAEAGEAGELSFQVLNSDGAALTEFAVSHERQLHLIVVRTDGEQYRHVHPSLDESSGVWSTPWEWATGGTYRVYADFQPDVDDGPAKVTLTRTVNIAGPFEPTVTLVNNTEAAVGDYVISLSGRLTAGDSSELTFTFTRDGRPVTGLEPYLGAFGHLVALREGDLAFLHVHAEEGDNADAQTAGPDITFAATAPTAGTYLLYLDFQIDGQVHTAKFVVEAKPASPNVDPDGGDDSDDVNGH